MSETVAIIDYGSGNLRSAAKAFERVAAERAGTAPRIAVTDDPKAVLEADRVVLPGVGAFADCMAGLTGLPGMRDALETAVRVRGVPFLGICVGMQLMADEGVEYGTHQGLGWISGSVSRLQDAEADHQGIAFKIPHMGWNELELMDAHPVFADLRSGQHAYFVHSYGMRCEDAGDVIARTHYGGPVTAVVARDNMVGTQFHPEKSQALGLRLIANFLDWRP